MNVVGIYREEGTRRELLSVTWMLFLSLFAAFMDRG